MLEAIVLAFVVLVAVALIPLLSDGPGRRITAYFATTIGVYPGSDVRVLGVRVGSVDSIRAARDPGQGRLRPGRGRGRARRRLRRVVAPNLVSDRYVQLAPAYTRRAEDRRPAPRST